MKKIFTVLCVVCVMAVNVSGRNVKRLVNQARNGDAEACRELALCYRDGDHVRQSWLNMLCMYEIYCDKVGHDIDDILSIVDEDHPFRPVKEIILSSSYEESDSVLIVKLEQACPVEAKAVKAIMGCYESEDEEALMEVLRGLEAEGSEMAIIGQWMYYGQASDKAKQEECYVRFAENYPAFNLLLGDLYLKKYAECKDFSYVRKAIECFYEADSHGMLCRRYAGRLVGLYDCYGSEIECSDKELARLKKLTAVRR